MFAKRIHSPEERMLRYVYILKVDNYGKKSKFFGHKSIFYVGQTNNLTRRFKEHLHKINSPFLKDNFPNSQKKLVFVDYVFGTEYDVMREELKIKKMSSTKKSELVKGERNKLVAYKPLRHVVLKKFHKEEEQIVLKL